MSRISIYSVYTSTYKRDVGCCCFFCIAVHLFNVSIVKKKKKIHQGNSSYPQERLRCKKIKRKK